ncbi:MAG: 50S ribosomal protein L9 [Proteobacteria bacterium]|nr:50S ribosomal protein L9 [Pseudomonadota bacterium]
MNVILKETIPTLGIIGAEVSVADGYARNYLLPQGKALEATDANRKILEQTKAKFELQIAKEKSLAEELAKKVETITCKISAKVAEENRLYGSVTTHDIMDSLKDQDVELERRMLLLAAPIKELGTYKVAVRLYKDVEPQITIEVVPEVKKD